MNMGEVSDFPGSKSGTNIWDNIKSGLGINPVSSFDKNYMENLPNAGTSVTVPVPKATGEITPIQGTTDTYTPPVDQTTPPDDTTPEDMHP